MFLSSILRNVQWSDGVENAMNKAWQAGSSRTTINKKAVNTINISDVADNLLSEDIQRALKLPQIAIFMFGASRLHLLKSKHLKDDSSRTLIRTRSTKDRAAPSKKRSPGARARRPEAADPNDTNLRDLSMDLDIMGDLDIVDLNDWRTGSLAPLTSSHMRSASQPGLGDDLDMDMGGDDALLTAGAADGEGLDLMGEMPDIEIDASAVMGQPEMPTPTPDPPRTRKARRPAGSRPTAMDKSTGLTDRHMKAMLDGAARTTIDRPLVGDGSFVMYDKLDAGFISAHLIGLPGLADLVSVRVVPPERAPPTPHLDEGMDDVYGEEVLGGDVGEAEEGEWDAERSSLLDDKVGGQRHDTSRLTDRSLGSVWGTPAAGHTPLGARQTMKTDDIKKKLHGTVGPLAEGRRIAFETLFEEVTGDVGGDSERAALFWAVLDLARSGVVGIRQTRHLEPIDVIKRARID